MYRTLRGKEHRTTVTAEGLNPVNFMADFKRGVNVVTVGNPEVMIPVVDCIQIYLTTNPYFLDSSTGVL